MFTIELTKYSSKYGSNLFLDLVVKDKDDPLKFHITFTAQIELVFEGDFCIKDCYCKHPQNLGVVSNSLLSEEEIEIFKVHRVGSGSKDTWSASLRALNGQLDTYITDDILEKVEVVIQLK